MGTKRDGSPAGRAIHSVKQSYCLAYPPFVCGGEILLGITLEHHWLGNSPAYALRYSSLHPGIITTLHFFFSEFVFLFLSLGHFTSLYISILKVSDDMLFILYIASLIAVPMNEYNGKC